MDGYIFTLKSILQNDLHYGFKVKAYKTIPSQKFG